MASFDWRGHSWNYRITRIRTRITRIRRGLFSIRVIRVVIRVIRQFLFGRGDRSFCPGRSFSPLCEVLLLSHRLGLREPAPEFRVNVFRRLESERVQVVPRGERLDAAKSGTLAAAREDDVAVEPPAPGRHLSERHANVERDARLLRKNLHRTNRADRGYHRVEERTNLRRLSFEVVREVVAPARVRLIAVREFAAASLAAPQRRSAQRGIPSPTSPVLTRRRASSAQ